MKTKKTVAFISYMALSLMVLTACVPQKKPIALTISCSFTLREEIAKITEFYNQEKHNAIVNYNTGGSDFLQEQIEQGAPVDILISINSKSIDALQAKGLLLPNTRQEVIKNQIVLIVQKNSSKVSNFQDLTNDKIKKVALGELQTTTVGQSAQKVLSFFKIFDPVKQKAIFTEYSQQIVKSVESGRADVGIGFLTDAQRSDKVKIVAIAPENSHFPLVYTAAVVKSTKSPDEARKFIQFLLSEKARNVFKKSGYILP